MKLNTKSKFLNIGLSLLISIGILSSCNSNNVSLNNSNTNVQANSLGFGNPFSDWDVTTPVNNNFEWGVSSAGYQSEGNDSSSMWYFWDISGKTEHRNLRAVDFYNRYEEDIQLAKDMGATSFRLSIEWSRIEPRKDYFDPQGIEYYRKVINSIKRNGMEPLITLIHFNYPQWVIDDLSGSRKGLENKDFIKYFLRYTDKVTREFGKDVKYWITFNEPNVWVPASYLVGAMPPGKINPFAMMRACWNLLKAHSKAYDLIHQLDPDAMVSSNVFYILPKPFGAPSQPPGTFSSQNISMLNENNVQDTDWFFEAVAGGNIAIDARVLQEESDSDIQAFNSGTPKPLTLEEDLSDEKLFENTYTEPQFKMNLDSGVNKLKKFDYVAFDYYYRFRNIKQVINIAKPWMLEMYPEGLYDAIMYYHRKYNKPIIIAENGLATKDLAPREDGWTRSSSIVQHIKHMKRAMNDGANVLGYYHWSITDNYEWGTFAPRFGLYTVDALRDPELKRVPTPAVETYKQVIQANGVTQQLLYQHSDPRL